MLAISGPTVFPGYVIGRDENGYVLDGLGKLVDGWLDTGDLARVDEDGFVYLSGRAKDLIIRGGHNIDPAVIEDALLAHPQVTAAAAVGRPDAHAGEVPVAYVTLAPEASVDRGRAARLGGRAGRRTRRRAQGRHRARRAPGHRGRQALQARAAGRRHPPRRRRRTRRDRRHGTSTPRSRTAPSSPGHRRPTTPTPQPSARSWAGTRSAGSSRARRRHASRLR